MFSSNTSRFSDQRSGQDDFACLSFLDKYINSGYDTTLKLNVCAFEDALYCLYLKENQEKILILYLHNHETDFSMEFCRLLSEDEETKDRLDKSFIVHPWDIGEERYHPILMDTLNSLPQLIPCVDMVRRKQPAVIFIALVEMDIQICSVLRDITSLRDMNNTLSLLVESVSWTSSDEDLQGIEEPDNDCGYLEFQQKMFDCMGNRDYDRYEANELDSLKEKISFALFGVPSNETGYSEKQQAEAQKMYDIIVETNNQFSEYENQVTLAIIYNCLIPLDACTNQEYNPVPVFVLRKCTSSEDPCRIIIDHTRRVYKSWNSYLVDNNFCKCQMVVPEDGRYKEDENGKIKLQKLQSPACGVGRSIVKATDVTTSVLGIGSTGVMVAAAIPAITVAPAALLGAAAVGAGVGIYSIGRSISTLIDRSIHKESLNVTEPESRGAYLNIAAGVVGFAGAGTNAVVSQLASNGVTVGTTARIAVNTLGVANIGIGGLAVSNSAVEIFMRWWVEDETPSSLSVLQLTTSILFFGHAIYSFKSAATLIEENQTTTMQKLKDALSSNKQRKMFRKLELETIRLNAGNSERGRAEIISAISRFKDQSEVFSFLSRNNKKFNELGVKFSAKGGQINFNGMVLNLDEISSLSQKESYSFFSNLPKNSTESTVSRNNQFSIDVGALMTIENTFAFVKIIVGPLSVKDKICQLITRLVDFLEIDKCHFRLIAILNDIYPNGRRYIGLMKMILSYIQKKVEEILHKLHTEELDGLERTILIYLKDLNDAERKLALVQHICDFLLLSFRSTTENLEDLLRFCVEWVMNAYMEHTERQERNSVVREGRKKEKFVICKECSGKYSEN